MGVGTLGLAQEANTFVGDEVCEVVEMVVVVVFDALSVVVDAVVVEATIAHQTEPLRPARRYVRPGILVQVFTEVACRQRQHIVSMSVSMSLYIAHHRKTNASNELNVLSIVQCATK